LVGFILISFLQSLLLNVLEILQQLLEGVQVAGNEDFNHILEGATTKVWQVGIGLGFGEQFDNDLWLVGQHSQVQA